MKSDCEFTIEWLSTGRRPGNKRGKKTIGVLGLNDYDRLLLPRVKIGDTIFNILDSLGKWVDKIKIKVDSSVEDQNELVCKIRNLLKSCQPDA